MEVSKEITKPLACSLDSFNSCVFMVLSVSMVDWVSSRLGLEELEVFDLLGVEGSGMSGLGELIVV